MCRSALRAPLAGTTVYFQPHLLHMEVGVATKLCELLGPRARTAPPAVGADALSKWLGAKAELELSPQQLEAVRMAMTSGASVITGGPGCGKTFTLRTIGAWQRRAARVLLRSLLLLDAHRPSLAPPCPTRARPSLFCGARIMARAPALCAVECWKHFGVDPVLVSPTGRGAQRLSEVTGHPAQVALPRRGAGDGGAALHSEVRCDPAHR
jgi:hypothetical protein